MEAFVIRRRQGIIMEKEIWEDVKGYEGFYKVSNLGKVKSLERYVKHPKGGLKKVCERILKIGYDNNRPRVELSKNGEKRKALVYRLVAESFIPNPIGYPEVNHKDENTRNNQVSNLEWCSHGYNMIYGTRTERASKSKYRGVGMYHPKSDILMKVFVSRKEAAEYMGVSESSITNSCSKVNRLVKGYKFKRM